MAPPWHRHSILAQRLERPSAMPPLPAVYVSARKAVALAVWPKGPDGTANVAPLQ
jgi:hypothetical protein